MFGLPTNHSSQSTISKIISLLVPFLVFFTAVVPASGQIFRVKKIMVCSNQLTSINSPCAEVAPPFYNLDRTKFANKRLSVKVWITGEKEALSFIENNDNVLPVNVAIWKDRVRRDANIDIGITQEKWDQDGAALKASVLEQGDFTWRTHFNVNLSDFRTVAIEINDAYDAITFIGRDPARLNFSFSR